MLLRGECKQISEIPTSPIKKETDIHSMSTGLAGMDLSSVSSPAGVTAAPTDINLKHKELWMKQWLSQQIPSMDDINTISVVDSCASSNALDSKNSSSCISIMPQTIQLFSSDKAIPKYLHRLVKDEHSVSANHSFAMKSFESKFVIRNCGSADSKVQVLCSSPAIKVECDSDNNCDIRGHSDVW